MMRRKYQHLFKSDVTLEKEIDWAYDFVWKKKVMGSMRNMQFGGPPVEKINLRSYNCSATYCDRLRMFQETMYILLCGSGCGYSVQKHHVAKLPEFTASLSKSNEKPVKTFTIPDNIEGWADSIGVLLSSYFEDPVFPEYYDCQVKFVYSKIRPKGSYLSSSSGKAPGPDPLKNCHKEIRKILDDNFTRDRLRPIDVYDILCHIADAVLSGGIRRSSSIALFSIDDQEMIEAKSGNWIQENPQRARANNSAVCLRNGTTFEQFDAIISLTKEWGDPGFIWVDNLELLVNPCIEIGFYAKHNGESGWALCNLSSINCGTLQNVEDFYERCRAASIIGTLQAGFTDFKYLGNISEQIARREALLGVSMTGMQEHPEIALDPQVQRRGARLVRKTNEEFAKRIGINPAARATAIKPAGTESCLLGTSSGIHPGHAKRYIRRVQANVTEPPYQFFKQQNKKACEKSVWSANDTDEIINFPIEIPDGAKTKNQVPALDMLEMVKLTQQNWIASGKNEELCVQPWLSHNVSNTVVIKNDVEWDEVTKYIYQNRKHFTGIALISDKGDKDFPQAPFSRVFMSHEIVREYGDGAIWCSGIIELCLQAFNENLWKACTAILDEEFPDNQTNGKKQSAKRLKQIADQADCKERAVKFAHKYFNDDLLKLTYCLKDVYNWKDYFDLTESFQPVDYTKMVETEDNTKLEQEVACGGGACLI
ncbi:MAG TPA: hypothetical protein VMW91_09420 [Desulfosporosinus sp.]|nr:hypothetical protein [Desulfosporosinus sp.]